MSQVSCCPKLMQLTSAATDQNAVEQREDRLKQKARYAWQPRRNANILIGTDAGGTRMASTSALLSDEALLRSEAKMKKAK